MGTFNNLPKYEQGHQTVLCYTFFILATFTTQITMFNMLIAIMGDTFSSVMEDKDVNAVNSKLELMSDLANVMELEDKVQN